MDAARFPEANPSPRIRTLIPARLDRLPWSRFHLMLVLALGVTWILDGLEVTLVGAVSGVLQDQRTLGFTPAEVGFAATCYLIGAVSGSLIFGYLTDRYGRRLFFFVTLSVYLVGALLTAFAWDLWSFIAFRMLTGAGIGGEYAAINSAIDELVPARLRGRIALYINGSYWVGAALGAVSTVVFLDPTCSPSISAGASASSSARCSACSFCWCAGMCRKACAGRSPTAAPIRPKRRWRRSNGGWKPNADRCPCRTSRMPSRCIRAGISVSG